MAETPSLGEAISLQGRNQGTEQLGRMAFQMGEAAKNRGLKADLEGLKAQKDAQKKALEQFEIPTGQFHRLVLPEIQRVQGEYVAKLKKLKEERPNDFGNEIPNMAREYKNKMVFYATASRDLDRYDAQTTSIDKGNTYFSRQWEKFNPIYETADDLTDLYNKMSKSEVSGDASLQIRNNGSISFTPIANRKPIETISKRIEAEATKLPFKSSEKKARYGYSTAEVKVRPVSNNPGIYGVSKAEIAQYNPEAAKVAVSIEDIVDDWMVTELGNGGVFQYADQNKLSYNLDQEGNLSSESKEEIKDHIMNWASNFASPEVKNSFVRQPSSISISVGDKEEGAMAAAVFEPSEIASTVAGKKSYKFGELGFSFDKSPQSISVTGKTTFDQDFNPVQTSTLSSVKADGVVILGVDKDGKPVSLSDITADNVKNLVGTDVFVRVKSGESASGYYYIKQTNYSQITDQFMKKPNEALQKELQKMILRSAKLDAYISTKKRKKGVTWEELTALPQ
jgi:hypothetical protein